MPAPHLKNVFYPSDFSRGDEVAFVHALRLAWAARAELDIFHANPEASDVDWDEFPSVRRMLQRWGAIPAEGTKQDVRQLGLEVHKVKRSGEDPVHTILEYLEDHEPDLIVLSSRQRRGLSRWMNRSIAEPVARESHIMTLFVPRRVVGFVAPETGSPQLEHLVIPVDEAPDPQPAVDAAVAIARTLGCRELHLYLLHVGDSDDDLPAITVPEVEGWVIHRKTMAGDAVDRILEFSEEVDADLIAMATQGRDGFVDALRGSTTEQVLRGARCPVLAIPAHTLDLD